MPHPLPGDDDSESRVPLIPIGLVVVVVLLVPMLLYSGGPGGPFKLGDVVFTTDRHRVHFVDPQSMGVHGYRGFCVLEARTQLLVRKTDIPPDGSVIAEVVGTESQPVPYCRPRVPIILHAHQATLKPDVWGGLKDMRTRLFSRF